MQTSLHICADWSAPLIFAFWKVSYLNLLCTGEISILQLVSVAEETGLSLPLSDTPKTRFLKSRPIQEVFHVYLNKFEIAVSHLFLLYLVIIIYIGQSDLQECAATKKISLNFIRWIKTVSEDE